MTTTTNADQIAFIATFDGPVQNVDASDFVVTGVNSPTVSVSKPTEFDFYSIEISGGDLANLNGVVGLDLALNHNISDLAGNVLPAVEPTRDLTITVDNIAPNTVSFTPSMNSITNADQIAFIVTFDSPVIGVDAADFVLTGINSANVTVSKPTEFFYEVVVSGSNLATMNGVIGLDLASTQNITDFAGNALPNVEPARDLAITVDNNAPTAVSFTRSSPTNESTSSDSLVFRAAFDEAVRNVDSSDFVVSGTTAMVSAVTLIDDLTNRNYDVTVSGGDLANLDGTVGLDFASSLDVEDFARNPLVAAEPTIDETFRVDNTAPALSVTSPANGSVHSLITWPGSVSIATVGVESSVEISIRQEEFGLSLYWDGLLFRGQSERFFPATAGTLDAATNRQPWIFELPSRILGNGNYVITIRSTDAAGHTGIATSTFRYDATLPRALVVDTAVDEFDGDKTSGDFSLREAIAWAKQSFINLPITFAASLNGQTLSLTAGELLVDGSIAIDGDGNNDGTPDVRVSAGNASRVFRIDDGATSSIDVTLEGLVIQDGGNVASGAGVFLGEADNLTLRNSTITKNNVFFDSLFSGAMDVSTEAQLNVISSTISDNRGGIRSLEGSTINVSGSTLSNNFNNARGLTQISARGTVRLANTTVSSPANIQGASVNSTLGDVTVNNSTFSRTGISKTGDGSVVVSGSSFSQSDILADNLTVFGSTVVGSPTGIRGNNIALVNSTVSGTRGVPIRDNGGAGNISITNSTITGNAAGIVSRQPITLANSIVLGNASGLPNDAQVDAPTVSVTGPTIIGTQLRTDSSMTTLGNSVADVAQNVFGETVNFLDVNGDGVQQLGDGEIAFGQAVLAGKLENNGGRVRTIGLRGGGPALDAAVETVSLNLNENSLEIDLNGDGDTSDVLQRVSELAFDSRGAGFTRRHAVLRGTATSDLGAFEAERPTIATAGAASVSENQSAVIDVHATDEIASEGAGIAYGIAGGDSALFAIDANTGVIAFASPPDFENPRDADRNNIYDFEVTASDTHDLTTVQSMTVTVTPQNDNAPIFTSPATANVIENTSIVQTLSATDADLPSESLTFGILGSGLDDHLFEVVGDQLQFKVAPDFEHPLDGGSTPEAVRNNVYEVAVSVSDGPSNSVTRTVLVTVVDGDESLVVTTPNDAINADGMTSLREAILFANLQHGADVITFAPALMRSTITLTEGELTSTSDLTIDGDVNGDDKADISISGDSDSSGTPTQGDTRIFNLTGDSIVSLKSLTLTNGFAGTGFGGAIFAGSGVTLNLIDSTVRSSSASAGGGIVSSTALNAVNATITGNQSTNSGGGVALFGGSATLTNATIDGNRAERFGGGISLNQRTSLSVLNSTITGNVGGFGGGGIFLQTFSNATVNNSVVATNGIDVLKASSEIPIAGANPVLTAGHSFFGSPVAINNDSGGNLFDAVANLGLVSLADNGGTVPTRAIQVGSPLLGRGNATLIPTDALDVDDDADRNETLPLAANGVIRQIGPLDIGAFEATPPPSVESVVIDDGSSQRSRVRSITVGFNSIVSLSGSAFSVKNSTTNTTFTPTVRTSATNGKTVARLTFAGDGIVADSLPDGNYEFTVRSDAVTGSTGSAMERSHTTSFYRFFGEVNGDRSVLGTDFRAFVGTYRKSLGDPDYSELFDVNGDNAVLGTDFRAFVGNYRKSLPLQTEPANTVDPANEIGVNFVQVDTGTGQRSMVRRLRVSFNSVVQFEAGAFSVKDGNSNSMSFDLNQKEQAGKTVVNLEFNDPDLVAGSLPDGEYELTIDRNRVFRDDFVEMLSDYSLTFHRLYGDHDASRIVDELDRDFFDIVRELDNDPAQYVPDLFDYDGDDEVNAIDAQYFEDSFGNSLRTPGDADSDGKVTFNDFLMLSANFGAMEAVWSDGDFDGNGIVDFADFLLLATNFAREA